MKSPTELSQRLARQWQQATLREQRLLSAASWPLRLPIGKPSATLFAEEYEQVRQHILRWRQVTVGTVIWAAIPYRASMTAVEIPITWELRRPSEWVAATGDGAIQSEFARLERLVQHTPETDLRTLLVRQRQLLHGRTEVEVLQCLELARQLQPGCAAGRPLRALGLGNVDSKFFERHRALLLALLDLRSDGMASVQGLENFLAAAPENEHWLLLLCLDPKLLPFRKMRVPTAELVALPQAAKYILLIENERCAHQLPTRLPDTIAILGAGLDLSWMEAPWLSQRRVAYWGDMDTWGLQMLAQARRRLPQLQALLMEQACFEQHQAGKAVPEPVPADPTPPTELTATEQDFYRYLQGQERGRLEQEFLPRSLVVETMQQWRKRADS